MTHRSTAASSPAPVRVLLVDDDPNDRAVAGRHLRRAFPDLEVTEVVDRASLDRAVEGLDLDLVITESHLGWIDGLAVLRAAKGSMPDVPVIMFTGSGTEEIAIEAMKAGLDDFVRKSDAGFVRLAGAAQQALERAKAHVVLVEAERRANAATIVLAERAERFVESGNDAIVTSDESGLIIGWNSRAEALFGWRADEAIGRRVSDLLVPERWRRPHLEAIATIIRTDRPAGMTRHEGDLTGLHRDGHEVPLRISTAYERTDRGWVFTGFARDLTAEAGAREELRHELHRREKVAASLARIRPSGSVEAIAESIAEEIARNLEVEVASVHTIFGRSPSASIVPLAIHAPSPSTGAPIEVGRPIPKARSAKLLDGVQAGPWVSDLAAEAPTPYLEAWLELGIRSAAYVPIGEQGDPIGLLIVGTGHPDVSHLERLVPDLVEYAAISAAYLGQALTDRRTTSETRTAVGRVIRQHRFRPVFQPIFDLDRNAAVGYEALTRFEDGRAPDVVFAEAEAVGLGLELETSTLQRIFATIEGMPFGAILSVNVSPELILSDRLVGLLPSWRERLVLEVTEHVAIDDYPAILAAIESLRPVSLAVDDAGAGFASLRHIIELQPDFVKLDISLVRGIDTDPARQGLVAGMAYFATRTDRTLIAEGIETAEERDALRSLGVVLGQGYLLGRPAPLGRG